MKKQICMRKSEDLWADVIEETKDYYIVELTDALKREHYIGSPTFNGRVGIFKCFAIGDLYREVK